MAKQKSKHVPRFKQGYVVNGDNQNIPDLPSALESLSSCDPCGCNSCLGYWTMTDGFDGTLKGVYINNNTLVIEDLATAITNLEVLKDAQ